MAQLKVLICGAGIAGNALAFWLSKLGYDVTVIERFPTLRVTGLQIDLRGYGIEVMKRMGIEKSFRHKSVQEQGLEFVDSSGRRRAYFPTKTTGKGLQSFSTDYEIMRGDLCQILYDETKDRVKYIFGTSIENYTGDDNSVHVVFSDGKTEQFDLLVGADGQGSRTRRMMFGPVIEDSVTFLGVYIAYFTIPQQIKQGEGYVGSVYIATQQRYVFTRRHKPDAIQVYLACQQEDGPLAKTRRGDIEEESEAMISIFRGAGWQTDRILKALREETDDFYCERLSVVKLPSWSSGRVTLLGDAAFCPSATTGMGTSSSLVGAYVLAGEIMKHCGHAQGNAEQGRKPSKANLTDALKAYESKFRPFMDQVQEGIAEGSSFWNRIPSSSLGIAILYIFMSVVAFLRLNDLGKWVLREDVKGWKLPEYKTMMQV
ncbi:hypothetical protein QQX98_007647 [Neonectria punicea]|uniref:FAD-binding domain-containing protein n=1 Tax=Neonectria punicea TaxID=979145 RepID=A0ABR1GXE6_9HYPO